jgi:predicted PurR-regulated permease PerM
MASPRLDDPTRARLLALVLGAGIIVLLVPFIAGLIGAGVVYVTARPAVRWLDRSGSRRGAALAVVVAVFLVLVLPGLWLLAEVFAQLPSAFEQLQKSSLVQRAMALQLGDVNVGAQLRQATSEIVAWSSRQTMAALAGVMNATLNLIVALFGAYYLLTSGGALWERAKVMLPFPAATADHLRMRFLRVTEAMLLGVALAGLAQGTIVGGSFAALGLPHAALWGAVTAAVSILPMFGSAIVWVPGALILAGQERYVAAAILAAIGFLIVSNVDNALRLVVYKRVSQVHPMITLVGAFAGVKMFGLAGLLIGPLVLSYGVELLEVQRSAAAPLGVAA